MPQTERNHDSTTSQGNLVPSGSSAAFKLGVCSRQPGTDVLVDCLLELGDIIPPNINQGLFFAIGQAENGLRFDELEEAMREEPTRNARPSRFPDVVNACRLVEWADRAFPEAHCLSTWYSLGVAIGELWLTHDQELKLAASWKEVANSVSEIPCGVPILIEILQASQDYKDGPSAALEQAMGHSAKWAENLGWNLKYISMFNVYAMWIAAAIRTDEIAAIQTQRDRLSPRNEEILAVLLEEGSRMTTTQILEKMFCRKKENSSLGHTKTLLAQMSQSGLLDNRQDQDPKGYGLTGLGRSLALVRAPKNRPRRGD